MADVEIPQAEVPDEEETAPQADEEEVTEPVDDTAKMTEEADDSAGGGGGGKPCIVYYNCLSRIVMAGFLIAAGAYAIPDVFINHSPAQNFQFCGEY